MLAFLPQRNAVLSNALKVLKVRRKATESIHTVLRFRISIIYIREFFIIQGNVGVGDREENDERTILFQASQTGEPIFPDDVWRYLVNIIGIDSFALQKHIAQEAPNFFNLLPRHLDKHEAPDV